MRILRYDIDVDAQEEGFWIAEVEMPVGAEPISCGVRGLFNLSRVGSVLVWALVPDVSEMGVRRIGILGTGVSAITKDELAEGKFIGTVVNGPAVWHVFDLGNKEKN